MNADQIKHMVNRFLCWRLPDDFNPDCGIRFDADAAKKMNPNNRRYEPIGTNLFDATQADEMVRYMVEGMPGDTVKFGDIPAPESIHGFPQDEGCSEDHSKYIGKCPACGVPLPGIG